MAAYLQCSRSPEEMSDPLGQESQTVVSHHMGGGN